MALASFDVARSRPWNEAQHPRNPKGSPGGGRFRSLVDRITDALREWLDGDGDGDPFEGFDREQLRKTAKARGITLKRGASRDEIAELLKADLRKGAGLPDADKPTTPRKPRKPAVKREKAALKAAGARLADAPKGFDESDPDYPRPKLDLDAELTFTNNPGWSEKTHKASSRALRLYRNSTYKKINGYLRGDDDEASIQIRETFDKPPTTEDISLHVALIDQAMEKSPLSSPVELWRGVDFEKVFGDTWREDDSMVGLEWDELGFVSTSADPSVGHMFSSGPTMRLRVPEGTGAIQLDSWRAPYPEQNREAELLLQRNLRLRVVGDNEEQHGTYTTWERQPGGGEKMVEKPRINRVLDVEVEVIPDGDGGQAGEVDTRPGAHGHGLPGQSPSTKEEPDKPKPAPRERTFEELLALAKALGRKIPPGATKADLLKLL